MSTRIHPIPNTADSASLDEPSSPAVVLFGDAVSPESAPPGLSHDIDSCAATLSFEPPPDAPHTPPPSEPPAQAPPVSPETVTTPARLRNQPSDRRASHTTPFRTVSSSKRASLLNGGLGLPTYANAPDEAPVFNPDGPVPSGPMMFARERSSSIVSMVSQAMPVAMARRSSVQIEPDSWGRNVERQGSSSSVPSGTLGGPSAMPARGNVGRRLSSSHVSVGYLDMRRSSTQLQPSSLPDVAPADQGPSDAPSPLVSKSASSSQLLPSGAAPRTIQRSASVGKIGQMMPAPNGKKKTAQKLSIIADRDADADGHGTQAGGSPRRLSSVSPRRSGVIPLGATSPVSLASPRYCNPNKGSDTPNNGYWSPLFFHKGTHW